MKIMMIIAAFLLMVAGHSPAKATSGTQDQGIGTIGNTSASRGANRDGHYHRGTLSRQVAPGIHEMQRYDTRRVTPRAYTGEGGPMTQATTKALSGPSGINAHQVDKRS